MTPFVTRAALVAALIAFQALPAHAVAVAGGIDPNTGLATLLPWALRLAGVVICGICIAKGAHAVAEGRSLAPHLGAAVGGTALAFGAPYLLTAYGVL